MQVLLFDVTAPTPWVLYQRGRDQEFVSQKVVGRGVERERKFPRKQNRPGIAQIGAQSRRSASANNVNWAEKKFRYNGSELQNQVFRVRGKRAPESIATAR